MRRLLAFFGVAGVSLIMGMAPASAHNAGPCNDSGGPGHSDYARHHITEATPGHVPGTHGGYSACLGTGRLAHQP